MSVLKVSGLCKRYAHFALEDVSFSVEQGRIMGFIGRNGAGKTTTLKSLLNFVHPDAGEICFFGGQFSDDELAVKRRIGFVSGGVDYFPRKKLRRITNVTRRFYPNWDEDAYRRYLRLFALDENKTPAQLSAGMKVKYALALALSHRAELLLLDEPTSGLDPVSRDDLLDVFSALAREGTSILFSTHITSDLDKCADDITYIQNGKIVACETLDAFRQSYRAVALTPEQQAALTEAQRKLLLGCKRGKQNFSALVRAADAQTLPAGLCAGADLEEIMVHLEKEAGAC